MFFVYFTDATSETVPSESTTIALTVVVAEILKLTFVVLVLIFASVSFASKTLGNEPSIV